MSVVTAIKERPILMSAPMVQAILHGTKTQTRRPITPRAHKSPFGEPGDRLWVRETFRPIYNPPDDYCIQYRADGVSWEPEDHEVRIKLACLRDLPGEWIDEDSKHRPKWRPSIHMPRWASRITLEVDAVRIERLQDISVEDCRAEGSPELSGFPEFHEYGPECYQRWFRTLWDTIYAKTFPWESNPWVWVCEFVVIENGKTID